MTWAMSKFRMIAQFILNQISHWGWMGRALRKRSFTAMNYIIIMRYNYRTSTQWIDYAIIFSSSYHWWTPHHIPWNGFCELSHWSPFLPAFSWTVIWVYVPQSFSSPSYFSVSPPVSWGELCDLFLDSVFNSLRHFSLFCTFNPSIFLSSFPPFDICLYVSLFCKHNK